jgi:transcriptional regulator with XRE-family HTH domain
LPVNRNRKTILEFIEDVIALRLNRGPANDAKLAKEIRTSPQNFSRWRSGEIAITVENLEKLTMGLLGVHFVQCLHLPHEVSELRAIEVETLNRLERKSQEVKKPGSAAGTG